MDEQSREPNVPERRSVLRGFKKFYAKAEYKHLNEIIPPSVPKGFDFKTEILNSLTQEEIGQVEYYMQVCM